MKSPLQAHKNTSKLLKYILIGVFYLYNLPNAKAVIPYIYQPNPKELKNTGINIAKNAEQLLKMGANKEAIRLAKLAISIEPNDYRIWSILGEAQRRDRLLDQAKVSLKKAKELSPQNSSLWFAQASLALQQKDPNTAEKLLKQGLALDPNNPIAYFQLGNARIMQFKPKLALNAFKKATAIQPKFWEALNNQGIVLFEIGNKKQAINTWRNVLKIKENAEPMLALAAALNHVEPGNKKVIELAKEALAKNPNYISSTYQKEQLWGVKLREATRKLLKKPILAEAVKKALANSDVK